MEFWKSVFTDKEAKDYEKRLRVLQRFGRYNPPYRNSWEAALGGAITEHLRDKKDLE